MLLVAAIDQRSADRAAILADQPCAGLDDADRITGPPVAGLRIGHEEGIENAGRGRLVIGGNGAVEIHRSLRAEVETIGGTSCRERVWKYVSLRVVDITIN